MSEVGKSKPVLALLAWLIGSLVVIFVSTPVGATALQIRPLTYPAKPTQEFEKLKPGEAKKGFVDISNAAHSATTVKLNVKGFKQIDNRGNLQFFESNELSQGIQLDLTEVELGPREALRVYFLLDSKKLPSGDVFAAIFASTKTKNGSGITPATEVGTLLFIQNGEGGSREAAITALKIPFFNFGDSIKGEVEIKNDGNSNRATGFFPKFTASLGPILPLSKEFNGPLVFAGNTRTVGFSIPTNRLGFYKATVDVEGDTSSRWIFIATGYWRWVVVVIIVSIALLILAGITFLNKHRSKKRKLQFGK